MVLKASGDKIPLADFVMISWTSIKLTGRSSGNQIFTACHVVITSEGVPVVKP